MAKPTPRPNQDRADRIVRLRQTIDTYKRDGVEARVLALAVEELQAAEAEPEYAVATPAPAPIDDSAKGN